MLLGGDPLQDDSSIHGLIEKLISHRVKFVCHTHDREVLRESTRRVRKKFYNLYFVFINGPHKHSPFMLSTPSKQDLYDQVYGLFYSLKEKRCFDMAKELLDLANTVFAAAQDDPIYLKQLHFLLLMRAENLMPSNTHFGSQNYTPPIIPISTETVVGPEGDTCYRDSAILPATCMRYTLFPSWSLDRSEVSTGFSAMPPVLRMDTHTDGFMASILHNSSFVGPDFLLGAVHNATNVCVPPSTFTLDLPDLVDFGPAQMRPRNLTPYLKQTEVHIDSMATHGVGPLGLRSQENLLTECNDPFNESDWKSVENVLQSGKLRFEWESRGIPQKQPLPYLSECSHEPWMIHRMLRVHENRCRYMFCHPHSLHDSHQHPSTPYLPCGCCQCVNTLLFPTPAHIGNCVLLAFLNLTSDLLPFDKIHRVFRMVGEPTKVLVGHLSESAVRNWLQSNVLLPATNSSRLLSLCENLPTHGVGDGGLVYRAWAHSLRQVLYACRGCVLACHNMYTRQGPIPLHSLLNKLRNTFIQPVNHLARCLQVDPFSWDGLTFPNLPRGLALIRLMFTICCDAFCTEQYSKCLLLFKHACLPFLKFLENWAFQGIHFDSYKEFGIQVRDAVSLSRDISFWTSLYVQTEDWSILPLDFAEAVFRCGKSLHFLRTVKADHFLFKKCLTFPSLEFPLDSASLRKSHAQVEKFVDEMCECQLQVQHTRERARQEQEEANKQLIQRARETTAATLRRLEAAIEAQHEAESEAKRAALKVILEDMEAAKKRREEEALEQKEEDRRFVESALQRENELMKFDAEMEESVRKELVERYEKLTADAAEREKRALWRIERVKRQSQLEELLREEAEQEQEALTSMKDMVEEEKDAEHGDSEKSPSVDKPEEETPTAEKDDTVENAEVKLGALKESDAAGSHIQEMEKLRIFRQRNTAGHASDSTMKELMSHESPPRMQTTTLPKVHTSTSDFSLASKQGNNSAVAGPPVDMMSREESPKSQLVLWKSETDLRETPSRLEERRRSSSRRGLRGNDSHAQNLIYGPNFGSSGKALLKGLKEKKDKKKKDKWARVWEEISQQCLKVPAFEPVDENIFQPSVMTDIFHRHRAKQDNQDDNSVASGKLDELLHVHDYIERVFVLPLAKQIFLVDQCLVDFFLIDLALESHLVMLKRLVLLDDGVFSHGLITAIRQQENLSNLSSGKLNAILQNCLSHSHQLSVDLSSLCLVWMQNTDTLSEWEQKSVNPFIRLRMHYEVSWPLNVLISPQLLLSYNRVFSLVLYVKQADAALQQSFLTLRSAEYSAPSLKRFLFRLFCHRSEMEHCVRVLLAFLHNQASEVAWRDLHNDLSNPGATRSLDDLIHLMQQHTHFILYRCFFTEEWRELLIAVENVLHEVLVFHEHVFTTDWSSAEGALKSRVRVIIGAYLQFKSRLSQLLIILGCFVGQLQQQRNLSWRMEDSIFNYSGMTVKEGSVEHNNHLFELFVRFHGNDFYQTAT